MKIVRAAIKFRQLNDSSTGYRIKYGWRHHIIFNEMRDEGIEYDRSDYESGFLVDDYPLHFVNRKAAAKIAYEAGQIPDLKSTLYSEDLWTLEGYPL